jgi:hypothetical protein
MRVVSHTATLLIAVCVAGLLGAACSGGSDETGGPTNAVPTQAQATQSGAAAGAETATTTQAPPATTAPTVAVSPTPTSAAVTKVSANNATRAQLQAAFEAAGISGAAQWAREVEEYRPYSSSDTNMNKLRQELAKYNPGPGIVDKIVATLSFP